MMRGPISLIGCMCKRTRCGDDAVDDAHLLAVRKHLLENGLLEDAAIDAFLRGTAPTVVSE
jgi:hypothetical protein